MTVAVVLAAAAVAQSALPADRDGGADASRVDARLAVTGGRDPKQRISRYPFATRKQAKGTELDRLIRETNECRHELGLPPLPHSERRWRGDQWDKQRLVKWRALRDAWCSIVQHARGDAILAIRIVFRSHAGEAITVARCESGGTFSPFARNGQYLGLFQLGSWERSRYGHSDNVLGQTLAAHRYWLAAGWRPWQCSPNGGLQW